MLPLKSITSRRPVVKRRRSLASRTIPMVIFAGALAGGVMSAGVSADNWPEWRGPARDGQSTEKGLPEKWSPAGEGLAWKVPIGSRSGPISSATGSTCSRPRARTTRSKRRTRRSA